MAMSEISHEQKGQKFHRWKTYQREKTKIQNKEIKLPSQ